MRLNNLSARLLVNRWLIKNNYPSLPSNLSYIDFASKLRKITAKKQTQVSFVSRGDAVAYIRLMAKTLK